MGILETKYDRDPIRTSTQVPLDCASVGRNSVHRPLVLIADNDENSRDLLKTILCLKGYRVIEGELQDLLQIAEEYQPGLIVVDVGWPFQAGLGMLERMRLHEHVQRVPTIVTSGNASLAFRAMVLEIGYEEFLVKPIDFKRLEWLVDLHLLPPQPEAPRY